MPVWLRKLFQRLRLVWTGGGPGEFLCDSCRYNYGSACSRRERPNARICMDYKRNR